MYDYINFTMPCPRCGQVITRWQTKDLTGGRTYELNQLWDGCQIYAGCDNLNCHYYRNDLILTVYHVTPPTVRVEEVVFEAESAEEEAEYKQVVADYINSIGEI